MKMRVLEITHDMVDCVEGLDACYPMLGESRVQKVPLVRLWGSTSAGQKVCVHLHKAFPYFYLEWPAEWPMHEAKERVVQLVLSINEAMRQAMKVDFEAHYVFWLELVRGRPFYGYTHGDKQSVFLRVFLLNPNTLRPMVAQLQAGAVMGTRFQAFEAHIPFRLQVFLDYNVYGMQMIQFRKALFRRPLPDESCVYWSKGAVHRVSGGEPVFLSGSHVEWSPAARVTHCELEVDCQTDDIIIQETGELVRSLALLWEDEQRRCGPGEDLQQPINNTQKRIPHPDPSALEQRYWKRLMQRIKLEEETLTREASKMEGMEEVPMAKSPYYMSQAPSQLPRDANLRPQIDQLIVRQQSQMVEPEAERIDSQEGLDMLLNLMMEDMEDDDEERSEELTEEDDSLKHIPGQGDVELDPEWAAISQAITEEEHPKSSKLEEEEGGALQNTVVLPGSGSQPLICTSSVEELLPVMWSQSVELAKTDRGQHDEEETLCIMCPSRAPPSWEEVRKTVPAKFPFAFVTKHEDLPDSGPLRSVGDPMGKVRVTRVVREPPAFFADGHFAGLPSVDGEIRCLSPISSPPSVQEVRKFVESGQDSQRAPFRLPGERQSLSGIEATEPSFRISSAGSEAEDTFNDHLTVLVLEVFALSAPPKEPDPRESSGSIAMLTFCVHDDDVAAALGDQYEPLVEVMVVDRNVRSFYPPGVGVHAHETEKELLEAFLKLVRTYDPDIVTGFEAQKGSLGYLVDRGEFLGIDVCQELARIKSYKNRFGSIGHAHGKTRETGITLVGRAVLGLWSVIRKQQALNGYSYNNCVHHVLHRDVPAYSSATLTEWWVGHQHVAGGRWDVIQHYVQRVKNVWEMYERLEVIQRTTEAAKIVGIDWYSAWVKGSQYRVESLMLRITKVYNFILISPTRDQVAAQPQCEETPLVMEPLSNFYPYPLVVLDFRSLYPSVVIAYNLCYSTCIGKLPPQDNLEPFTAPLGVWKSHLMPGVLKALGEQNLTIAPNGYVFVKKKARHGVLPRMLTELLNTRVMVKAGIKRHKGRQGLLRRLDGRQRGLKMIANVTYGYTAASFTGRMPCVHLADAIVGKGRRALEQAIRMVHETPRWNSQVVYGDTDSLFVLCKGASRERAFQIGREIAHEVTQVNPYPVKLQFEKVYHPCVLMAKKRYVGWKWEHEDQEEGDFDAKGIETVRRDTCGIVQKLLKHCLKLLFTTADISQIKEYLQRQFALVRDGRVALKDFIFAKEVKLGKYKKGHLPPGGQVAMRLLSSDHRKEPLYGERVPYVVVYDPDARRRLIDSVRHPDELLCNPKLRISSNYYIQKQIIPVLNRVFTLMGISVKSWFDEMPRSLRLNYRRPTAATGTIDAYYTSLYCDVCGTLMSEDKQCLRCKSNPQAAAIVTSQRHQQAQRRVTRALQTCKACAQRRQVPTQCVNLDCDIFYERTSAIDQLKSYGEW